MNTTVSRKILLIGLMSTLTACQSIPSCPTMPVKPAHPKIKIERTQNGGYCVDSHDDAVKMSKYIYELQLGYE